MESKGQRTILVNVNHVLGTTDRAAVAIGGVVVATVELVQDQGCAVTANVLDLGQLIMRHEVTGGVTGVRGQQHLGTTRDFLGDLIGVDVIVVLLRQRDGDGRNLFTEHTVSTRLRLPFQLQERSTHVLEQRQHLRIRRVIGDGEGKIRIAQNSSNSDQTRASAGNNADILPSILTLLPLAIMLIVQTCNGSTQRLDTGGRAVLPSSRGDRD